MPLLELPHWLMIAGVLLLMAGFIGLALRRKNEVETDPVLLPGAPASWKPQQPCPCRKPNPAGK
jgi:LPXTG-motif cell wall-anchored protein